MKNLSALKTKIISSDSGHHLKFGKLLVNPNSLIAIILCVVFAIIYILNYHTEYASDDFVYHFFYDIPGNPNENTHRMKMWEVTASMFNHWKLWNGRVIAHGMLQLVLLLGKRGFDIFNSIMFVLLGFLIYQHAAYGQRKSPSLLVLIYVCMWFFFPTFGVTILWASGAANYLWTAVLIMAFTLPYRMYLMKQNYPNNTKMIILMGIGGFFAGCTNENSGGAMILLCIMFLVLYSLNGISIPRWGISGCMGSICGAFILIMAPGNRRMMSTPTIQVLFERWKNIMNISKDELSYPLMIMCVILLLYLALDRKAVSDDFKQLPVMYFFAGISSICVLIFSPMTPPRAWFIGTVFFIVIIGYVYENILIMPKWLIAMVTSALIVAFALSFCVEFPKILSTDEQVKEGIALIENAVGRGDKSVSVPLVKFSDSNYDAFNGAVYLEIPADNWVNAWMAEYYGIDFIFGYEREE